MTKNDSDQSNQSKLLSPKYALVGIVILLLVTGATLGVGFGVSTFVHHVKPSKSNGTQTHSVNGYYVPFKHL